MSTTQFLNVDLDLHSKGDLTDLLNAFGGKVVNLKNEDKYSVSIELANRPDSVDDAILNFSDLVCGLSPKTRVVWDLCDVRSMNIGIQAGVMPYSESFKLSNKAISLLSSINAEVVFTIYGAKDS